MIVMIVMILQTLLYDNQKQKTTKVAGLWSQWLPQFIHSHFHRYQPPHPITVTERIRPIFVILVVLANFSVPT